MIATTLNTLKLHLNLNTALHSIVLTACTPSSVTHNGEYTREEGEGKTKLRDRARTHSSNTIPQIEG